MSKGKFAPGKRVMLLRSERQNPRTAHFVNTLQVLLIVRPDDFDEGRGCPRWELAGIRSAIGEKVAWSQKCMILIDPDETPEQSIEAMRCLHDTTAPVKAKSPDVVRPFKWEAL